MIKIEGSAINNLIAVFLQNLNLVVGHISDYNKWMNFDYPEYKDSGYVMPFGDGPGDYVSALLGEQTYINILNYAQKKVYISTPYLVPTYSLLDALRSAALRGVEVNLIVPGMPDKPVVYWMAKSNFRYLLDAGVNIYLYRPGFNHMKTAIADNELGFVGTINFDFRSLVHHFECGAILYKCPCMSDITKDFEQMIEVSEKVPQDYKFRGIKKSICSVLKIISALF
jgi:cardiolipin synthase